LVENTQIRTIPVHQPKGGAWVAGQTLEESEARYRQLIYALPSAIYTCDKNGYITMYNEAAADLWGREPEIGKDLWCGSWKIFEPDGTTPLPLDCCPMAIALKEGRVIKGRPVVIQRPDGVKRYVEPYPEPLFDKERNIVGAVNMLVDVTEQKAAGEERAKLAAIVQFCDDAIISKTLKGIITSWNPAAEKMFGYAAEEMIGQSITKIIPPDRLNEETEIQEKLRKGNRVDHFETKRLTKTGELLDISLTISPIMDPDGRMIGASKIARDITVQKKLRDLLLQSEQQYKQIAKELEIRVQDRTKDLTSANRHLERSNKELEQFAFITSHDLQEPLRKIQLFADLLYTSNVATLDDTSKKYIEKISASSSRMSLLIRDLLNLSRMTPQPEDFTDTDLYEVFQNIKIDLEVVIEQKKAQIITEKLPVIQALPLQMNQLFYNIVSNALKFAASERTAVLKITSRPVPAEEMPKYPALNGKVPYVEITFQDNGIGFNPVYKEKVFEIFQRLHTRNEYEGTGIGLALCNKIVLNHKGSIFADSKTDVGTSFHVILPLRQF